MSAIAPPPIWLGTILPGWSRLLARNRFAVAWPLVYEATMITVAAGINSLLGHPQDSVFDTFVAMHERHRRGPHVDATTPAL